MTGEAYDPTAGASGAGGPLPAVPGSHPSWCSPAECTVSADGLRGAHSSASTPVPMGPLSDQTVTVHLHQSTPLEGHPDSDPVLIIIDIHVPSYEPGEPDHESGIILGGESAEALGRILISASKAASR